MLRLVLAMLVALGGVLVPQAGRETHAEPPTSQPASQPTTRTAPRRPEQARILQELLRDSERLRARPILSVPDNGDAVSEAGPRGGSASVLVEGTVLIERPGRLVRRGDRSEFHFTSGGLADGVPSVIEFNKNGWLEAMEDEAEAGVQEFIISAETSSYRGRNYLLLRKYRRQVSHGNLSP